MLIFTHVNIHRVERPFTAVKLEVKPWTDIVVHGADGCPLAIEGVPELFARDPQALFWKKLKLK